MYFDCTVIVKYLSVSPGLKIIIEGSTAINSELARAATSMLISRLELGECSSRTLIGEEVLPIVMAGRFGIFIEKGSVWLLTIIKVRGGGTYTFT